MHVQQRRREEGSDLDQRSPESKFTSLVGIRSTSIGFDCDPIGSVVVWNNCVVLSRVWEVDSLMVSSGWISTVGKIWVEEGGEGTSSLVQSDLRDGEVVVGR